MFLSYYLGVTYHVCNLLFNGLAIIDAGLCVYTHIWSNINI